MRFSIREGRGLRACDKRVVVLMVVLLLMGLTTLFSATYYQRTASGDALSAVKKQLIGVALGAAMDSSERKKRQAITGEK